MTELTMLVDYKSCFGSKYTAKPYRSGMDKVLLAECFQENGYTVRYLPVCEVDLRSMDFRKRYVLPTSSEDDDYMYKSYIEDICYALHLQGAILIPDYKYLRAHSNKVFTELLRDLSEFQGIKTIKSRHYGCLEDLRRGADGITFPVVLKGAGGAKSKYVSLANNKNELIKKTAKVSRTKNLFNELWDVGRSYKHRGYIRESKSRRKFILQNFVDGLQNDWKILVFGKKYYVLKRETRKNDFRASGSGIFQFPGDAPREVLDFAKAVFDDFKVPHLSLDIGFDGNTVFLFEFQVIFFGSTTLEKSPRYYESKNGEWSQCDGKSILEKVYAESVDAYLKSSICSRGHNPC